MEMPDVANPPNAEALEVAAEATSDETMSGQAMSEAERAAVQDLVRDAVEVKELIEAMRGSGDRESATGTAQRRLNQLIVQLCAQQLGGAIRKAFVRSAIDAGIVDTTVRLVEEEPADVVVVALHFLNCLVFGSTLGSRAVLAVFDRIIRRFQHMFDSLDENRFPYEEPLVAAITLCGNLAGNCPDCHRQLVQLVKPVFLKILASPRATEELQGSTILLLANLSLTVGPELRSLRVAEALLKLVLEDSPGRGVAESVIIFLHGSERCEEIDKLLDSEVDVIGKYCVPIMECALQGEVFRDMYPYLMYSARLLSVLSTTHLYAQELVRNERIVPLLLEASGLRPELIRVDSDFQGQCLALEALQSLVSHGLWPRCATRQPGERAHDETFLAQALPKLLDDDHTIVRRASAGLWARMHRDHVLFLLLVSQRLDHELRLPPGFMREKMLAYLFPSVAQIGAG